MSLKLKDWDNADETGTRFPKSKQLCPGCNQSCLMDTWPPDYGSTNGAIMEGGGSWAKSTGSQKFVCVPCKIAFRVFYMEETRRIDDGTHRGKREVTREINVSETIPLVEKDGYLLTPHDVWIEEYKDEYGEYPTERYA